MPPFRQINVHLCNNQCKCNNFSYSYSFLFIFSVWKIYRKPGEIFLNFGRIYLRPGETCLFKIKQLIQEEYSRHDYLLESPKLKPHERDYFQKIMNLTGHIGDYENSLETAVKSALEQIETRKYETELLQRGIKRYKKLAIVFKGKEVTIKEG